MTEVLNRIRFERARAMLRLGGVPLCEVAAQLGYSEVSSFHRVFVDRVVLSACGARCPRGGDPAVRTPAIQLSTITRDQLGGALNYYYREAA